MLAPNGTYWTATHFGAVSTGEAEAEYFTGNLPSIKKPKEAILAASPKKGPTMHDTPPKPSE